MKVKNIEFDKANIVITNNDSLKEIVWEVSYEDDQGNVLEFDLTGFTVKMQVREYVKGDLIKEFSNSMFVVSGNEISLSFNKSKLAGVLPNTYVYDIEIESTTERYTIGSGNFEILYEITEL